MAGGVDIHMPLYIGDYLRDTGHLSAEEHGAYLLLIMSAWTRDGRLPNDARRLSSLARVDPDRWPQVWEGIRGFFTPCSGNARAFLEQKRVMLELEAARRRKAEAEQHGRKGAEVRWGRAHGRHSNNTPTSMPEQSPSNARAMPEHELGIARALPEDMPEQWRNDGSPASASESASQSESARAPAAVARARARNEGEGDSDSHAQDLTEPSTNAASTSQPGHQQPDRVAALPSIATRIAAEIFRPMRLAVEPEDPIRDPAAWDAALEEDLDHLVRLLEKHPHALVERVMRWAMQDEQPGARGWRGWKYRIANLRDFARHFEEVRKAYRAAEPAPTPRPPNGPVVTAADRELAGKPIPAEVRKEIRRVTDGSDRDERETRKREQDESARREELRRQARKVAGGGS
jgi:uncharacterized protein YdaU (DUF1376 family)